MFTAPAVLKDKYLTSLFLISAILLVISFSFAYVNFSDTFNLLVIHFDSFRGIDFLGDRSDVAAILGTAAVVFLINGLLAHVFYFRERFLSYALAVGTVFFSLLILIGINVIISVN
ncbi:MAG: hypothetical protein A3B16_02910 [Candidatus Zambryskibacteria bacterium RIFCSPLOWO2_01_FULL_45_43]|uniref:DUF5658 domain-containing protein n=2 Tax=Parcubacteria group TaxID=1794811 RepID=A0A1G1ZTI1_9BACT|nr:MAG: hypothetical protein A3H63_00880 [Candidatus Harrisonbacteria bacterium RIFCSPLOWO2_02_FULL_45_10c]OHB06226.1 MAG: hypothetical protein A3B16_02910 [Candidatus Zambryskibacteria bacterium RIFCSPLOWO2_01_FULL_45_43]